MSPNCPLRDRIPRICLRLRSWGALANEYSLRLPRVRIRQPGSMVPGRAVDCMRRMRENAGRSGAHGDRRSRGAAESRREVPMPGVQPEVRDEGTTRRQEDPLQRLRRGHARSRERSDLLELRRTDGPDAAGAEPAADGHRADPCRDVWCADTAAANARPAVGSGPADLLQARCRAGPDAGGARPNAGGSGPPSERRGRRGRLVTGAGGTRVAPRDQGAPARRDGPALSCRGHGTGPPAGRGADRRGSGEGRDRQEEEKEAT